MNKGSQSTSAIDLRTAMDTWGDMVLRLALCRTQQRSDAEDVFQTVFLKLYERNPRFKDEEHVKAWLLRLTINCCNDLAKSAWSARRTTLDDTAESLVSKDICPAETEVSHINDLIINLPDKQRTVIHLFYYEGYSTNEIAFITEEKVTTVRSHLFRAREALKITLRGIS